MKSVLVPDFCILTYVHSNSSSNALLLLLFQKYDLHFSVLLNCFALRIFFFYYMQ